MTLPAGCPASMGGTRSARSADFFPYQGKLRRPGVPPYIIICTVSAAPPYGTHQKNLTKTHRPKLAFFDLAKFSTARVERIFFLLSASGGILPHPWCMGWVVCPCPRDTDPGCCNIHRISGPPSEAGFATTTKICAGLGLVCVILRPGPLGPLGGRSP